MEVDGGQWRMAGGALQKGGISRETKSQASGDVQ